MLQLIRCFICFITLLVLVLIWGYSISKRLKITAQHLPMQMLIGFFAFFFVMQLILIPVVFLHNSLRLAAALVAGVSILLTIWMLWKDGWDVLQNVKRMQFTAWFMLAFALMCFMMLLAVLQSYPGYDTCYYVGEMNAFVYYGEFWTRNAFSGMIESSAPPLHYALSCFYPFFATLAYLFHVDARLIAMYTARSLCVFLFVCVAYSWGYELFEKRRKTMQNADERVCEQICHRNGCLFAAICLILSFFLMDDHSSAFMMMVRGYESKGYCAAIVAPMCTYALIQLCRDAESASHWRLLGLVAWASVPIAMSSLAVIPFAIAIVGLILMVVHKKFRVIFKKCLICVGPNVFWLAWYVLGA